MVYFDKDSLIGHPSPDKWIPLEIKEGRKTDLAHKCPKRNNTNSNGSTLDNTAATTIAPPATIAQPIPAIIAKPEMLQFAETLVEILQEYITLKLKEQATAK